ncbi:MAG TPA: glycosyltransferase family 4 protein [Pyrinomonadaceae bacterium]|nr:glycosyltransferase family 4 protein [Pyrinomonadaceae bacterium]
MRILLLMDPLIAVPPREYGGIERVVADLANELHRRGHGVTVWAAPGSHVMCELETFGCEGEWTRRSNIRNSALVTARFWSSPKRFDIVHNFGRLAYLLPILRWDVPKIQTYMRWVENRNIRYVNKLGARRITYTAVSNAIRNTGSPGGGDWRVIYNCAPKDQFAFREDIDPNTAPLVFLGRLERCKGAHSAIAVARRLNRRLIIAGNISNLPEEKLYFQQEIKPNIDGELISYIGPVNNEQKNRLLGEAAAMLLPIEWEEPFPIVLPESMLCGTPVIAFRRGGVPEGIDHGRTGFVCDNQVEMAELVLRLNEIDRRACRQEAEARYSAEAITDCYENLYREVSIGRRSAKS